MSHEVLTRQIGRSRIEASAVGLGTWAIGGWMWGGTDERQSIDAIRAS
ncbi:MAG: aldo/keto reductase, partial [Mesorhizobium sp.]